MLDGGESSCGADEHALIASAEAEIHSHIFSRVADEDHEAKMRRVAMALDYLGDPQDVLRVIHVMGTNGKTSTSRMAASLLSAHGLKVGLFTSPHLHTLRERIQVDGIPLDQAELVLLWQIVAPVIHRVDAYSARIGGPRMSFFEVLTVLGIVAFSTARVDVAVIEVEIGGARDATNVCEGEVAVLTPMGIDHSEYFGGTIEGVAKEKAGIIKSHATVVTAVQADEVATILTAVARRSNATPIWEGAQMSVISSEPVAGGRLMTLATAAHAPLVVLDAAHNPHGVAALARAAREVLGDRATIGVIAVLADKDARGILEGVSALVDRVVVTRTSSDRALSADDLERVAIDALGAHRVQRAADVSLAIAKARDLAGTQGALLVTGSIALVAQARHELGMTLHGVGQAGDAASLPARFL